jgi:hypothetical protein
MPPTNKKVFMLMLLAVAGVFAPLFVVAPPKFRGIAMVGAAVAALYGRLTVSVAEYFHRKCGGSI